VDDASVASIASALEAAISARASRLQSGTPLVRKLALRVSRQLGLDESQELMVDACAQLRDVGMIGLPDSVILSTGPLSPGDWMLMNSHPERGAELLKSLPGMAGLAGLVRAHHERWDGEGYPDGLRGDAIPLASRIVAVCDAFTSIATDRPHRRGAGAAGALDYIVRERGEQFDPVIVDCLVTVVTGKESVGQHASAGEGHRRGQESAPVSRRPERAAELNAAIAELEVLPVFGPAAERALYAASLASPLGRSDLVAAIESDVGLTVAVLRLAQVQAQGAVSGVADAVARVGGGAISAAIAELPRLSFPWRTGLEALLLRSDVHAQAVARATDRLAQAVRPFERDDLVAAALVHDVGKLLLAAISPDLAAVTAMRHTPEERVAQERRTLGYDHASLGGLLTERWGLDARLVTAVSAHHRALRAGEAATLVRLADMVVHHAHGDAVDRNLMLRLAAACVVPASSLRDVVFDQPHTGGGARRRAEPSPLSTRETGILRLLAEGRRAAEIARELDLTESTIRSHLHKTYAKLDVPDRTQAVLKATEMSWI
jgi:HD-GYP domain-containing protein (c-di-GMP phosphodiesterase class II)/DNA-binding CsgD family transcriptional regulator